jgi:hypothetical protein
VGRFPFPLNTEPAEGPRNGHLTAVRIHAQAADLEACWAVYDRGCIGADWSCEI